MKIENFKEITKKTSIILIAGLIIGIVMARVVPEVSRLMPENPDINDLRYTLSALAQSLAAILAIVISLTLLVLRETSNRYSTKFVDLFLSPKSSYTIIFWITVLLFLIAISLDIISILNLNKINISNSWHMVKVALLTSFFALILLVIYMLTCLVSLKPSGLMNWIIGVESTRKLIRYVKNEQEKDPLLECKLLIERLISLDEKESFDKCLEIFVKIMYYKGFEKKLKENVMFYLIDYLHFLTSKAIAGGKGYVTPIIYSFEKIANECIKEDLKYPALLSIDSINIILREFENRGKKDPIIADFDALKNSYFGRVKFDLFDDVFEVILKISDKIMAHLSENADIISTETDFWERGGIILERISEIISEYNIKALKENNDYYLMQGFRKLVSIGCFLINNFNSLLLKDLNPLFCVFRGIKNLILSAKTNDQFYQLDGELFSLRNLLETMRNKDDILLEQFKEIYMDACDHFISKQESKCFIRMIELWGNPLQNNDLSNKKAMIICDGLKDAVIRSFKNLSKGIFGDWKYKIKSCVHFLIYAGIKFYDSEIREKIIKNIGEIDSKSKHHISSKFVPDILKDITDEKFLSMPYEKLTEDEYKIFLRFKEDYFGKYK